MVILAGAKLFCEKRAVARREVYGSKKTKWRKNT